MVLKILYGDHVSIFMLVILYLVSIKTGKPIQTFNLLWNQLVKIRLQAHQMLNKYIFTQTSTPE